MRHPKLKDRILALKGEFNCHDIPDEDAKTVTSRLSQLWKEGAIERIKKQRPGRYGSPATYRVKRGVCV